MSKLIFNKKRNGILGLKVFQFINENTFNALTPEQVGNRIAKLVIASNMENGMNELTDPNYYKVKKIKYRRRV